jgi:hypothetical protein
MKLNDLENKNVALKALKENFALDFDVSRLDGPRTRAMLKKIANLIHETKKSPKFYRTQHNPSYMKMLFMEEALTQHLMTIKPARIVLENEEVEKSQVILAAQDMVDSVQKMYEEVNDMLVKELPALADSIQSEIGVNESTEFNTQVSGALSTLNTSLLDAKNALQAALGGITGQAGPEFGADSSGAEGAADVDAAAASDAAAEPEAGAELPPAPEGEAELPPAPEEPEPKTGNVGRTKR